MLSTPGIGFSLQTTLELQLRLIQSSAKDEGDDSDGSFHTCFLCLALYSHIACSAFSLLPGRNGRSLWWTLRGTGITAGWLSLPFLSSITGACWWPGKLGGCRVPVSSDPHVHLPVVAQARIRQLVLVRGERAWGCLKKGAFISQWLWCVNAEHPSSGPGWKGLSARGEVACRAFGMWYQDIALCRSRHGRFFRGDGFNFSE